MIEDEGILEIIKRPEPISIIRLGDGEMGVLNGYRDPANYTRILVRQLGVSPSFLDAGRIRENLIEAINGADVLGLPFGKEKHGGYWANWQKLLDEFAPVWREKKQTYIDINNHFLDKSYFDEILQGIETLNYIGCRPLDYEFERRYGIKNVKSYIIAPEMAFTSGYEGKTHFPKQYDEINGWLHENRFDGQLCLVAAGFTGKIYCNWFRDAGGRAFDVGNVMDLWAGKATRGPGRGRDAENNEFKL